VLLKKKCFDPKFFLKFFGVTSYPTFVVITNKGEVLSQNYLRPTEDKFDIDLQRMLEAL